MGHIVHKYPEIPIFHCQYPARPPSCNSARLSQLPHHLRQLRGYISAPLRRDGQVGARTRVAHTRRRLSPRLLGSRLVAINYSLQDGHGHRDSRLGFYHRDCHANSHSARPCARRDWLQVRADLDAWCSLVGVVHPTAIVLSGHRHTHL
jgi:hypothetical protein